MKFYEIYFNNIPNASKYFGAEADKMSAILSASAPVNPRYDPDPLIFPLNVVPEATRPVDFDPNFDRSFSDLCDERAIWLINEARSRDLDLIIKYSGGTDSTVVLSAILKWIPSDMMDRFYVALTNDSILENPWFFIKYVRPLQVMPFSVSLQKETIDKSLIVDGTMMDGLVGSGDSIWEGEGNLPHHTNKEVTKKYLGSKYFDIKYRMLVADARKNSPVPVDSIFELLWWQAFNGVFTVGYTYPLAYNHYIREMYYTGEVDYPWVKNMLDNHTVSFYRPPEFQQWVLVNLRTDQVVSNYSHKAMSKAYISDFIRRPYNNIKMASGVFMHLRRECSTIGLTDKLMPVSYNDRAAMRVIANALKNVKLL